LQSKRKKGLQPLALWRSDLNNAKRHNAAMPQLLKAYTQAYVSTPEGIQRLIRAYWGTSSGIDLLFCLFCPRLNGSGHKVLFLIGI